MNADMRGWACMENYPQRQVCYPGLYSLGDCLVRRLLVNHLGLLVRELKSGTMS